MELLRQLRELLNRRFARGDFGQRGEDAAARYLRRRGHRILARRVRSQMGELDLVTMDNGTIVFVEVKSRRSDVAGTPSDAVSLEKQRQLTRLALAFLKTNRLLEHRARFDVVAITWPSGRSRPEIQHFANAFEATGNGQFFS